MVRVRVRVRDRVSIACSVKSMYIQVGVQQHMFGVMY